MFLNMPTDLTKCTHVSKIQGCIELKAEKINELCSFHKYIAWLYPVKSNKGWGRKIGRK